jgi:predicted amidohydrolase YtcJ
MYLTMNVNYNRDDWWTAYTPLQQFGPNLQVAGLKITFDQEWGETVFFDQAGLDELVQVGHERGFQIAIHAFTPETDLMVLNAYGTALGGESNAISRHRLEHIGVLDDEGLQRMADLGIIGSVQLLNTAYYVEDASFVRQIPREQYPLVSRWRDLLDAGVLLIANVDSPWCCTSWRAGEGSSYTGEVMDAIYQGVTRTTYDGREPEPWQTSQVLTVQEALEMLTIWGAYAAHQEDVLGSLAPGKYADLVVLSDSPLDVAVGAIPNIDVVLTMIAGQTEYCQPGQVNLCP